MDSRAGTHRLTDRQCWDHLEQSTVGRLAWCEEGQPVVVPVNVAVWNGALLMRSGVGSKAAVAAGGGRVAFQVDAVEGSRQQPAWSVLAKGRIRLVEEGEVAAAAAVGLEPEAGTLGRDLFVAIDVDEVTGVELLGSRGSLR